MNPHPRIRAAGGESASRGKPVCLAVVFLAAALAVLSCGCTGGPGEKGMPPAGEPVSITISGSTTVQPVSEMLAAAFMQAHPGVRVTVRGGGSGKGIAEAGEGTVSIGSASRMPEQAELAKYPLLRVHRVGGSGIVVIAPRDFPADVIGREDLARIYDAKSENLAGIPGLSGVRAAVQRSDASGTEETFAQWLFGPSVKNLDAALNASDTEAGERVRQLQGDGNMGVLSLVRETPGAIGFVDFGFAEMNADVKMLRIEVAPGIVLPPAGMDFGTAIGKELAGQDGKDGTYAEGLTRPLLYVTGGDPGEWERAFIGFAQSPEAAKYFREIGYFHITEIGA